MLKKIFIRSLIAFLILVIISLIFLPHFAKKYAINNSKELFGRHVQLKGLKVNYFTSKIRITDFTMFEENGIDNFVTFDTLIINLKPYKLITDDFVLENFYLKGLKVNIIQADSAFNFDDLLAHYSETDDTLTQESESAEPIRFHLSNIELHEAEIHFEDQHVNKLTSLRDISFFVPYIGWNQEDKSEAGLRFAFKNEGYFQSSIHVDPVIGDFIAQVEINHLYLNAFKEYAAEYMNINSLDGVFNSIIQVNGNIGDPENSVVTGFVEVDNFELTDKTDRKFLGAEKLEFVISEFNPGQMNFLMDSVILRKPYVYFELDTASNNFFEVFNITTDSVEQDSAFIEVSQISDTDTTAQLLYAIDNLIIEDGTIDYKDRLTGEPFDYYLSEIHLETDSILSTSTWIDLYADMLLNNRGSLKAEVGLNPQDPLNINLQYVIRDFQLADLNIYSRFYMGFPIVYGDLYYQSDTKINNGKLNSSNKLIAHNVELGEKAGGLYNLPMKFALFILKDRDGVITLDVPVSGDLNDPKITVRKIIWSTFKNLIVKVAASPFDLLAGLISVDPKDIQAIEFQYADTVLNDVQKKQLDMLLKIEEKKDGLKIELVYFNDHQKEVEAIATEEISKRFFKERGLNAQENPEEFKNYVFQLAGSDTSDVRKACTTLVDSQLMDSLANMNNQIRKEKIDSYLNMTNESTNITSRMSNPKAPKNTGSIPIFEVKYSMKGEESTLED